MGTFDGSNAVWVGIGGDVESLGTLQSDVGDIIMAGGWPGAEFPFQPRLTIGRINGVMSDESFAVFRATIRQQEVYSAPFDVADLALYASVLTPDGPQYTVIRRTLLHDVQQVEI